MIWTTFRREFKISQHSVMWYKEIKSKIVLDDDIILHCEFGPATIPAGAHPLRIQNMWILDGRFMNAAYWAKKHPLGERQALLIVLKYSS